MDSGLVPLMGSGPPFAPTLAWVHQKVTPTIHIDIVWVMELDVRKINGHESSSNYVSLIGKRCMAFKVNLVFAGFSLTLILMSFPDVRCGDILLAVNGRCTSGIPYNLLVRMLKELKGRVVLTIVSWPGSFL
ncbi:unnamed protein product [Ranitomeya imitator]|uniref:PDZ domain-containing protein n=1 Tax=Ranitomeya imitator TaxID=111125 RepID=A0ABN9L904_9NEOB|nr:unnamed protein product [Ranitomeya imitator]